MVHYFNFIHITHQRNSQLTVLTKNFSVSQDNMLILLILTDADSEHTL